MTTHQVCNLKQRLVKFHGVQVPAKGVYQSTSSNAVKLLFLGKEAKMSWTVYRHDESEIISIELRFLEPPMATVDVAAYLVEGTDTKKIEFDETDYEDCLIFRSYDMAIGDLKHFIDGSNRLTLHCYIATRAEAKDFVESFVAQRTLPLSSAFDQEVGHDAKFVIGKKTIPFAKFVLMISSKVFAAMFSNEWKDCLGKEIVIEDFRYETMYEFVKSLYTRRYDATDVLEAFDVYLIADKYDVEFIKEDAMNCIKRDIEKESLETAIELFESAVKFDIGQLTSIVTGYFKNNLTDDNVLQILTMGEKANNDTIREASLNHIMEMRERKLELLPGFDELDSKLLRLILVTFADTCPSKNMRKKLKKRVTFSSEENM